MACTMGGYTWSFMFLTNRHIGTQFGGYICCIWTAWSTSNHNDIRFRFQGSSSCYVLVYYNGREVLKDSIYKRALYYPTFLEVLLWAREKTSLCLSVCHVTELFLRAKTQQNLIAPAVERYLSGVVLNADSLEETITVQNVDSLDRRKFRESMASSFGLIWAIPPTKNKLFKQYL